ncbi:malonyl-CoA decarboxylase [Roseospirillum parvum]|uniref:Malonyl-CoA decarboxylase n=1 Tax=Roseospirillum parvum TaxID=83401 RepID=A0A1G7YGC3_9PROT|nr:malonyl-CoA decarboxylase [Roseospirillum parvum]SDG95652.1 malonyl-CoA decarboxylase [Roseospirillum parvum]
MASETITETAPPESPQGTGGLGFMERFSRLWHGYVGGGRSDLSDLKPGLPESDLMRVQAQMEACLEGLGGEVSARQRAAALGRAYTGLNEEGRARFLHLLAAEYGPDRDAALAAMAAYQSTNPEDGTALARAAHRVRQALQPPRVRLMTQFNALPEGVHFLVDMRAELLRLSRRDPALKALQGELKDLLTNWFDVGFLNLERLTWRSPAAVLEKIIAYEAVHRIDSWQDLKNRLDSDRRLYAFFHPRMPEEPLIFVQVALVGGISDSIQALLDEEAPVLDPTKADTAIFYSISNAQRGLAGISFGNFLIKRVVQELSTEFPNLKTFATLSPIPGFRAWLDARLAGEGIEALLTNAERKTLKALGKDWEEAPSTMLAEVLGHSDWLSDEATAAAVKPLLQRLAARYLYLEKRSPRDGVPAEGPPTALDPVAHFHLTNGARLERLNWMADTSTNGLTRSAGMMVNYLYKLNEIEKNHESYTGQGRIPVSSAIRNLAEG